MNNKLPMIIMFLIIMLYSLPAETLEITDGSSITGEIIFEDEKIIILSTEQGNLKIEKVKILSNLKDEEKAEEPKTDEDLIPEEISDPEVFSENVSSGELDNNNKASFQKTYNNNEDNQPEKQDPVAEENNRLNDKKNITDKFSNDTEETMISIHNNIGNMQSDEIIVLLEEIRDQLKIINDKEGTLNNRRNELLDENKYERSIQTKERNINEINELKIKIINLEKEKEELQNRLDKLTRIMKNYSLNDRLNSDNNNKIKRSDNEKKMKSKIQSNKKFKEEQYKLTNHNYQMFKKHSALGGGLMISGAILANFIGPVITAIISVDYLIMSSESYIWGWMYPEQERDYFIGIGIGISTIGLGIIFEICSLINFAISGHYFKNYKNDRDNLLSNFDISMARTSKGNEAINISYKLRF